MADGIFVHESFVASDGQRGANLKLAVEPELH
jgi:hypothetical protein